MSRERISRLPLMALTIAACLPIGPALADSKAAAYLRATMGCAALLASDSALHAERCFGTGWKQTLGAGGAAIAGAADDGSVSATNSSNGPGSQAGEQARMAAVPGDDGVPDSGPVTSVAPTGSEPAVGAGSGGNGGSGGMLFGSGGSGGSGGAGGSGGNGGGAGTIGGTGGSGGAGGNGGLAGAGGTGSGGTGGTGGKGGAGGFL